MLVEFAQVCPSVFGPSAIDVVPVIHEDVARLVQLCPVGSTLLQLPQGQRTHQRERERERQRVRERESEREREKERERERE